MNLKLIVDKLEDVEEAFRSLYEEKDGKFHLKVDGLVDPGPLLRAKERETQAAKDARARAEAAEAKAAELQQQIDDATTGGAKKRGDVETLTRSYEAKLASEKTASTAEINKLKDMITGSLLNSTADALATEISTVPSVMKRVLKERLSVEITDDGPVIRILDAEGKISALTLADLKKEVMDNKEYAPIIVGTKGSGGGASGNGSGATKKIKDMTEAERREAHAKDPVGFQRQFEAERIA